MNTLTLNIGLAIDGTGQFNSLTQVVDVLERAGFDIQALRVLPSDTEPTVVAQVESAVSYGIDATQAAAITRASMTLAQDCIAAWDEGSQTGLLLGPRPYAGGFVHQLFVTLDGSRLPEALPLAA